MRCLNRVKSSLAGIALLSVLSFGAEVSVDKFSENLLFSGRWEHGKEYSRTSAPAAMVQFNAQAKSLEFELEGEARFRVDEDGKQIAVFTTNSRSVNKVKTSGDGSAHRYRLIKISESNPGSVRLYKVSTDKAGKFATPPKQSNRRIEFIGDSFTVGFGNEGQNGQDESLVFEKTNASKSYAFLIADGFKADFQVNAFSGRGLVRNYDNIVPEWPVPRLYEYTVPGDAPGDIANGIADASLRYDFGSFHPQVVVIFIGINDFQGNPPYADKGAFKKAYAGLLEKLRKVHPGVKFLLLSTKVWPNDDLTPTVKSIYDAEVAAGKRDVEFMVLQTANVGLLGHPDIHSHEDMVKAIRSIVGRLGGWLSR
jgi:lysophospholipase L1-like esterase